MRSLSLLLPPLGSLLVLVGCAVRVPRSPPAVTITWRASVHTEARVSAPAPPVALQGAPVPEFFGIPLDNTGDVVFVLDCSGSMDDPARGAIAQIAVPAQPPPPADASPPPAPPSPPPAPPPAGGSSTAPPPPTEVPPGAMPAPTDAPPPATPPAEMSPPPPTRVPRKIEVAQAELVDALRRLPAGTRINVLFFNADVDAYAATPFALDDARREDLIAFVWDQIATGRTALTPAMRTAFLMDAHRIVLLSDGLGNVGDDARALLRDAREAMRGEVRIDTIGLGDDQDAALLDALARESGGLYRGL